jgi:Sulfotransferase family
MSKNMWPVFIFGTGRCGSTHIQRLITLGTDCWVWGEHEGFLAPLLASVRNLETSKALERNVFSCGAQTDDDMIFEVLSGSSRLSWINRLDKAAFRAAASFLIETTFRSQIPKGWTEWGFKEILYGLNNNAPAILLELFPSATSVFTFRQPKSTIESMIRTWSPELIVGSPSPTRLSEIYAERVRRWKVMMHYFLGLRSETKRIVFVGESQFKRGSNDVFRALGLVPTRIIPNNMGITNSGPSKWPEWAKLTLDELFTADKDECNDLFRRASLHSETDFA